MIIKGTTVEIPDSLIVGGNLDLWNTNVTELPAGLSVGGYLDLRGTKITALPVDLTVGGWLEIHDSTINELSEGLTIGGMLFAYDGQLIASETVQLGCITQSSKMYKIFKEPTEMARILHQMLWEL